MIPSTRASIGLVMNITALSVHNYIVYRYGPGILFLSSDFNLAILPFIIAFLLIFGSSIGFIIAYGQRKFWNMDLGESHQWFRSSMAGHVVGLVSMIFAIEVLSVFRGKYEHIDILIGSAIYGILIGAFQTNNLIRKISRRVEWMSFQGLTWMIVVSSSYFFLYLDVEQNNARLQTIRGEWEWTQVSIGLVFVLSLIQTFTTKLFASRAFGVTHYIVDPSIQSSEDHARLNTKRNQ